jgi:hypothetical protein
MYSRPTKQRPVTNHVSPTRKQNQQSAPQMPIPLAFESFSAPSGEANLPTPRTKPTNRRTPSKEPSENFPVQPANPTTEATKSTNQAEKHPLDPYGTSRTDAAQHSDTTPEEAASNHLTKPIQTVPSPSFRSRTSRPTEAFTSTGPNERSRLPRRWKARRQRVPDESPKRPR